MKEEDVLFINQLIKGLEEAESKLEKSYKKKDSKNFEKIKEVMLDIQVKISEAIK